jgi:hypothetical protein
MRFLMTISCLLFAACSAPPPPPPPASEAAKRDSIRLYIECLINAARSIDDGVSDALTVGNAIRPTCETEYRFYKHSTFHLKLGLGSYVT